MAILLKLRLVLGLLLALGYSTVVMAETSKSVLIINSWSEQLPWQQSVERGFLQAMDAEPNTIVYTEHLDAERFPTEDYQDVFATYLTQKYKSIELESVVAESLPAVEFISLIAAKLLLAYLAMKASSLFLKTTSAPLMRCFGFTTQTIFMS